MNNKSCRECAHYTDALGDDGYCKMYRHKLYERNLICSKFQDAEGNTTSIKKIDSSYSDVIVSDGKNSERSYLIGFSVSLLLSVLSYVCFMAFDACVLVLLYQAAEVAFLSKLLFSVISVLFITFVFVMVLRLIKRFFVPRVIVSVLSALWLYHIVTNYESVGIALKSIADAVTFLLFS